MAAFFAFFAFCFFSWPAWGAFSAVCAGWDVEATGAGAAVLIVRDGGGSFGARRRAEVRRADTVQVRASKRDRLSLVSMQMPDRV